MPILRRGCGCGLDSDANELLWTWLSDRLPSFPPSSRGAAMLRFDPALCHSIESVPLLQNGAARICELGTPNARNLFFLPEPLELSTAVIFADWLTL